MKKPPRIYPLCRKVSLIILIIALVCIFLAPFIELTDKWEEKHPFIIAYITNEQRQLAELDLKEKVYKEIQARFGETNDWLFRKFTLAGGLLAAFLFRLWWPLWSPTATELTFERRQDQAVTLLSAFFQSSPICAVLGLACLVSLYVDIHIRRSAMVINELGSWAAHYGAQAFGRSVHNPSGFYSWEEFIRASGNEPGMHQSFITAIQTANLAFITGALFILYHLAFREICRQGLDWFNRLTSWLVLSALFLFVTGAHLTSGNFEFVEYKIKLWGFDLYTLRRWLSGHWFYFICWGIVVCIHALWEPYWRIYWKCSEIDQKLKEYAHTAAYFHWERVGCPVLSKEEQDRMYFLALSSVRRSFYEPIPIRKKLLSLLHKNSR